MMLVRLQVMTVAGSALPGKADLASLKPTLTNLEKRQKQTTQEFYYHYYFDYYYCFHYYDYYLFLCFRDLVHIT